MLGCAFVDTSGIYMSSIHGVHFNKMFDIKINRQKHAYLLHIYVTW